jgi:hypothetical protein
VLTNHFTSSLHDISWLLLPPSSTPLRTTLDKVKVALRRDIWNSILTGLGSSQLQVYRRQTNSWQIFLKLGRDIPAVFCPIMKYFLPLFLLSALVLPSIAELPVLNQYVLAAVKSMPSGGGYEASQKAVDRLAANVSYQDGTIHQNLKSSKASFCSGATYIVFLRTIEKLRANNLLTLSGKQLQRYAKIGVQDGEDLFGRWNANGPGTAKLFTELGCGVNFTSFAHANPGDFMKIWWTDAIGKHERGHLVVYLSHTKKSVKFWSSNQPSGYGSKTVSRSRIKHALFSRLTRHDRLAKASGLSKKNQFLADMLRKDFTWTQVVKACRVRQTP